MSKSEPLWTVHGTVSCYTHGKCRCDLCQAAMAADRAQRRADAQATSIPDDVVHGASCYSNYGCRCPVCVQDKHEKDRLYRLYGTTLPEWISQVEEQL